jgi:hypothetical protein
LLRRPNPGRWAEIGQLGFTDTPSFGLFAKDPNKHMNQPAVLDWGALGLGNFYTRTPALYIYYAPSPGDRKSMENEIEIHFLNKNNC